MDAYEVACHIRSTDAGNAAYLVAITGWSGAEDKRKVELFYSFRNNTKNRELWREDLQHVESNKA